MDRMDRTDRWELVQEEELKGALIQTGVHPLTSRGCKSPSVSAVLSCLLDETTCRKMPGAPQTRARGNRVFSLQSSLE